MSWSFYLGQRIKNIRLQPYEEVVCRKFSQSYPLICDSCFVSILELLNFLIALLPYYSQAIFTSERELKVPRKAIVLKIPRKYIQKSAVWWAEECDAMEKSFWVFMIHLSFSDGSACALNFIDVFVDSRLLFFGWKRFRKKRKVWT